MLSQVKGPPWVRSGSGIPSISTAYAQAQCCCAQVIHIFMHSQRISIPLAVPAGSQPGSQPASQPSQRAGAGDDTASGPDARLRAWRG